jgi:hypothetical protein
MFFANAKYAFRAGKVSSTQWDDANVGNGSFCVGQEGQASGDYSAVTGYGASAPLRGESARGSAIFSAYGDSQHGDLSLMRSSSQDTAVELTITGASPGAGERLLVPNNQGFRFRIELSCICTAGTGIGLFASWEIKGAIKNIGGTTSIVGALTYDASATDSYLYTASVIVGADDTNDCLTVTCAGVSSASPNTFHWHAAVYLSRVG